MKSVETDTVWQAMTIALAFVMFSLTFIMMIF